MVKTLCLLSAALPSLAVKPDDPQVLLQLANLHRESSTSVDKLHHGVQTMQTRLESMMQQAIDNSADPNYDAAKNGPKLSQTAYAAMTEALTMIESQLESERDSNDADWLAAVNAVGTCNTAKDMAFAHGDGVDQKQSDAEASEGAHVDCRTRENTLRNTEYSKFGDMMVETNGGVSHKPICPNGEQTASQMLTHLEDAKKWSDGWQDRVGNSITAYTSAGEAADSEAEQCDGKQRAFELDFCQYKVVLETTCSTFTKCKDKAEADRQLKRADLEAKEKAEKIILKSCSKVRCYLDLIQDSADGTKDGYKQINQTKYNACKNGDGTFSGTWKADGTDILNITWAPLVEPDTCNLTPVAVVPGPDWAALKYDKLAKTGNWMEKSKDNTPIQGIEATMNCENHLYKDLSAKDSFEVEWGWRCKGRNEIPSWGPGIAPADDDEIVGNEIAAACARRCLANPACISFEIVSNQAEPTCNFSTTCGRAEVDDKTSNTMITYFRK